MEERRHCHTLLAKPSDWKCHALTAIQFGLIDPALDRVADKSLHIISIYAAAIPIAKSVFLNPETTIRSQTAFAGDNVCRLRSPHYRCQIENTSKRHLSLASPALSLKLHKGE
jgi:hypothetical protein